MSKSYTAENAKLEVESGQTLFAMAELADSGDNKIFSSGASRLSNKDGFAPEILPNGIDTGGIVTPDTVDDQVDVAALTAYRSGVKRTVSASPGEAITRGVGDGFIINSITLDSSDAIVVVVGTEGSAFSETRGGDGGPPYIPTGSIEIAQVRLTSTSAAAVTEDEIFQVVGQHQERYDYPLWDEVPVDGDIEFVMALPLIHTGDLPKEVFGKVYEPIFAAVSLTSEFVPPEGSYSVGSTQLYGATIGNTSKSIGQGSFTAHLKDGITDAVAALVGELLWFRFYPDRYKSPYILCQGKLGMTRSFPAGDNISGAFTISASEEATNKSS